MIISLSLNLIFSCFSPTENHIPKVYKKVEKSFDQQIKHTDVRNGVLQVYSPSHNINWNFAGGQFMDHSPVTPDHPFLTASLGKTFTATAIAILSERKKLNFSDKINLFLPQEIVQNLHVFKGQDYSQELTIAHLLQHTSGLPDYFEDTTWDGSQNMIQQLFSEPHRKWQPEEAIHFVKEKMNSLFPPGQGYHYTDTEYVLLGMIIEKVSGQPLHRFFEEHFFKPLQMHQTAMHLRSPPLQPVKRLTECYAGDYEISAFTSLTADWAGGGLTATVADLNNFQVALHSRKLISPETLIKMQQWVPESKGIYYGFGLRRFVFSQLFPLLPKLEIIGHSGSTGSFMYYCPQLDIYLAGTLNQTNAAKRSVMFLVKTLSMIKKHLNS
ncbi:MAG: serine hydrolase domain-containing protein [Candidatus Cyclobacteriaceae bacterium M3_2C_046]